MRNFWRVLAFKHAQRAMTPGKESITVSHVHPDSPVTRLVFITPYNMIMIAANGFLKLKF